MKQQSYASFGGPKVKPEQVALEAYAYAAGVEWAIKGNEKLPRMADVYDPALGEFRSIPIVRSTSAYAHEFVRGWKAAKQA